MLIFISLCILGVLGQGTDLLELPGIQMLGWGIDLRLFFEI